MSLIGDRQRRAMRGWWVLVVLGLVWGGTASAQNLLINPGFETGTAAGWFGFAGSSLAASSAQAHTGGFSGLSFNRLAALDGPGQKLTASIVDGQDYRVSCWVRLANSSSETAMVDAGRT